MFEFFYLLGIFTFMLNGFRPWRFDVGLSEMSFFVAFAALVVERILGRLPLVKWLPWHPFWITTALIGIGGCLSTFTALDPAASFFVTAKVIFVFSIWIAMGIVMIAERKKEKRVILAFCAVPVFSASVAIFDFLTHSNYGAAIAKIVGNDTGDLSLTNLTLTFGRFSGVMGHPNIQSEFTSVVIPIVLVAMLFAWRSRQLPRAIALSAISVLAVWANVLTGSITGLVSVCFTVGVILLVGWLREFPRYFIVTALIGIATGLFVLLGLMLGQFRWDIWYGQLVENSNINRALNTTGPGRVGLVEDAFASIADQPITGYGMDALTSGSQDNEPFGGALVHNGIVRAWLYGGIFVFLGVVYAYLYSFFLAGRMILNYLQGQRSALMLGLAISTLGWIISDMASPSFYQRFTWFTIVVLYGLYVRERASIPVSSHRRASLLDSGDKHGANSLAETAS